MKWNRKNRLSVSKKLPMDIHVALRTANGFNNDTIRNWIEKDPVFLAKHVFYSREYHCKSISLTCDGRTALLNKLKETDPALYYDIFNELPLWELKTRIIKLSPRKQVLPTRDTPL